MKIKINVHSFEFLSWFLGNCRTDEDLYQFDRLQLFYAAAGYTF